MRLDVNVTFNDGEIADLEMQIDKSDDNLKKRAALYAAALLFGQSKRGKRYKEIKRVYQIFFLNCVLFPNSGKLPRRYSYREEEEGDRLTEAVEIIFYEMPKLEQRVRDYLAGKAGAEVLREDEKWCIYMRYRHDERAEPLIKELCRKEEGIMRAERALAKVDRDYIKYIRNMNIIKNSMDRASLLYDGGLAEGLAQGKAEGIAEGEAKANLEIARKMKAMGDSIEKIHAVTGLPSDTIEKL
jgi:predicted transposase/invertase (TIGR01784 family)